VAIGLRRFDARELDPSEELFMNNEAPPLIHTDPEIMGGTPVFWGTRVPARSLLDHLEKGDSLDDFLDNFPTVSREQAVATLRMAGRMLLVNYAHSA